MEYIIRTRRLSLRELEPGDTDALMEVLSDPESMRYYPHPFSRAEVEAWIGRNIDRYRTDGFGLWAVIRNEDDAFLGDCGITIQNIESQALPEVGFHIIKRFRRNRYASEAALGCMTYAAERFGMKEIFSYCESGNLPSQGVMKQIGMSFLKTYTENGTEKIVYSRTFD